MDFFDLVGEDLLAIVEEARLGGRISRALNVTFNVLIPKRSNPSSFNDFGSISLYNLAYKLIYKIIANIPKKGLSKGLSKEQIGFLFNRQILDALGMAQESIPSIKQKKITTLVLKLDVHKAYDRIDWAFLRLVLL